MALNEASIRGLIRSGISNHIAADKIYSRIAAPMRVKRFDEIYQEELRKIAAELNSRPGALDT